MSREPRVSTLAGVTLRSCRGWRGFGARAAVAMALTCSRLGQFDVFAEEAKAGGDMPWLITLGSYAVMAPRFEGASRYAPDWRPIFTFRRADEREWLELPHDGFGIELYESDVFRFGPVVDWRFQRRISNDICAGCRAFGSVELSLEGGIFAEYWPLEWLRTRLEVRHAVVGGAGVVADLSSDAVWRATPKLLLAAGPRISFADRSFIRVNYDLDPAVAAVANSEGREPPAGLRSAGFGGYARWTIDSQWAASAYTEWEHLAHAPIESPRIGGGGMPLHGVTIGIGLSYTFAHHP